MPDLRRPRENRKRGPICWSVLGLVLVAGCTFHTAILRKVNEQQVERSRELAAAAKIANEAGRREQSAVSQAIGTNAAAQVAIGRAWMAYDLSGEFLRREQNLLGLPVHDQTPVIVDSLSNLQTTREAAATHERGRESQEEQWAAVARTREAALIEMGTKYEAERNKSIVKRFWGWLIATFGIGGIIALCIFFPFLIPIFGRILAWIVGKIPALAGAIGVVSTKGFDAVVRGIQRAKEDLAKNASADHVKMMTSNLSKEMDQEHKDLVEARLPIAKLAIAARAVAI